MARDDAGPQSDDPGPIETGPVTKGIGTGNIHIGKIHGRVFAIGPSSSALGPDQPDEPINQALDKLQEFIDALTDHEAELADLDEIKEAAVAVQAELASPHPKLRLIRRLLQIIAMNVNEIAVLADLISNIQSTVARL
jgi:hypothetical protein